VRFIVSRQGPWNVDLETPPGPEGSNGNLLRIRRGYPGFSDFRFLILDCEFLSYSQGLGNPKSTI
jgi:hypothetical protein